MASVTESSDDRLWYIAQRWQQYEGEARANLLRIVAIGSFYVVHLFYYFQAKQTALDIEVQSLTQFHTSVTALAVAWTMMALAILLCLKRRIFPGWMPYCSTLGDVVLLTSILSVGDGPRSPLVVGYFLVIVLAGLRFSLPLVRTATVGSMIGYICLLGCAKWPDSFGKGNVDLQVSQVEQFMTLLALGLTGVMLGQILRRVRHLANDFVGRLGKSGKEV